MAGTTVGWPGNDSENWDDYARDGVHSDDEDEDEGAYVNCLWAYPDGSVFENARGIQKLLLAEYLRDASILDTHLPTFPRNVGAPVLGALVAKIAAYEPGIIRKIQEHVPHGDPALVVRQWRTQQRALYDDTSPQNVLRDRLRQEHPHFKSFLEHLDKGSVAMFKEIAGSPSSSPAEKARCRLFFGSRERRERWNSPTVIHNYISIPFGNGCLNLFQGPSKIKKIIPNGLEGVCPHGIGLKSGEGPPYGGYKSTGADSAMQQDWLAEHVASIGDKYTRRVPLLPPGTTADVYKIAASVSAFLEDTGPIPQHDGVWDAGDVEVDVGESLIVFKHGPIPTGERGVASFGTTHI